VMSKRAVYYLNARLEHYDTTITSLDKFTQGIFLREYNTVPGSAPGSQSFVGEENRFHLRSPRLYMRQVEYF
jgi:hypothetical protein